MSRLLNHISLRKRILLLLLPVLAVICSLLYLTGFPITEGKKFSRFTQDVFRSELSGNTLNLHYTVADPARYGIDDAVPSLGKADLQSRQRACDSCRNYLSELSSFRYDKLSLSQQLTYDIFKKYLETELSSADLLLYDEPLSPTLGIQAQLPVLFAEYTFRTKHDIENYLSLLTQLPDYFGSILSFENEKAAAGLFMSNKSADAVMEQCRKFIENPDRNYLIPVFDKKIELFSNLTADEKIAYKDRNRKNILSYVIPAYDNLIRGISSLCGKGVNDKGLYYYPKGIDYYEYLVAGKVGDERTIPEIEERIKQQMVKDFSDVQSLQARLSDTSVPKAGTPQCTGKTQTDSPETAAVPDTDPAAMLKNLRSRIKQDFPAAPAVSCEIKYVDDSMKDYLSPAFYLTPAIDNYKNNVIYINPAGGYQGLELYTTLAHEGYPGHLYQSVFFQALSPDLLRCILSTGGYTEGWATYVEMYSYSLWPKDARQAVLCQKNRSFTLGLAALLDIGIHYRGYSSENVKSFLHRLGFGESSAETLYQTILQSPANYLQYYVGYLNFTELRDSMKSQLGDSFTLKAFHEAVLKTGPVPFSILKKEVPKLLGLPLK